jgi:hypothetical protein
MRKSCSASPKLLPPRSNSPSLPRIAQSSDTDVRSVGVFVDGNDAPVAGFARFEPERAAAVLFNAPVGQLIPVEREDLLGRIGRHQHGAGNAEGFIAGTVARGPFEGCIAAVPAPILMAGARVERNAERFRIDFAFIGAQMQFAGGGPDGDILPVAPAGRVHAHVAGHPKAHRYGDADQYQRGNQQPEKHSATFGPEGARTCVNHKASRK